MGIQSIVIADYEHSKGISIIRPETLIVPELLVDSIGWKSSKNIRSYPGIKEDVYVPDFKPDDSIIDELGIKENCIIVTLRPPAIEAHYHNPESEVLFIRTVNFLLSNPNTVLVILPRNVEKEAPEIRSKWKKYVENRKIIIPEKVVNGLNLIWNSDLVISGGGTMNREAAALNIPVFSIFRGQLGEVDKYLIRQKRLIMISSAEEIENQIFIRKRIINDETINKSKEALYKIVSIIEKNVQEVS
jgi:predicted glycosyltransferase